MPLGRILDSLLANELYLPPSLGSESLEEKRKDAEKYQKAKGIYKKVKEVKAQLRVLRTLYYFFGGTACLGNLLISCKGDLCSL